MLGYKPGLESVSYFVEMPYKQMPVLEVDGMKLAQSAAIGRYLARVFNLYGKSDLESAKADECSEAMNEIMMKLPWTETDKEKKVAWPSRRHA